MDDRNYLGPDDGPLDGEAAQQGSHVSKYTNPKTGEMIYIVRRISKEERRARAAARARRRHGIY